MSKSEMAREDQKTIRINMIAGIREKQSILKALGFETEGESK